MLEVFLVDVISWCVWTISVDNADSSLSIITNYSECDVRYSFNARKLSLFFVYKLPFSGCDVVISVFFLSVSQLLVVAFCYVTTKFRLFHLLHFLRYSLVFTKICFVPLFVLFMNFGLQYLPFTKTCQTYFH